MKTLLISAAFAAAVLTPSVASAQAIPSAVVAVVDLDRVTSECNECKTASATLRGQARSGEGRRGTVARTGEAERKSSQASSGARGGREADAALQARVKAF